MLKGLIEDDRILEATSIHVDDCHWNVGGTFHRRSVQRMSEHCIFKGWRIETADTGKWTLITTGGSHFFDDDQNQVGFPRDLIAPGRK